MYLDELQEVFATSSGVEVSHSTVWRTLRRAGFTMKKVVILLLQFVCSQCSLFYQVTCVAAERSAAKQLDYMNWIGKYEHFTLGDNVRTIDIVPVDTGTVMIRLYCGVCSFQRRPLGGDGCGDLITP